MRIDISHCRGTGTLYQWIGYECRGVTGRPTSRLNTHTPLPHSHVNFTIQFTNTIVITMVCNIHVLIHGCVLHCYRNDLKDKRPKRFVGIVSPSEKHLEYYYSEYVYFLYWPTICTRAPVHFKSKNKSCIKKNYDTRYIYIYIYDIWTQ